MAGAWVEFFVAFAVFMAAHRIPTAPQTKVLLQARLGARGFTIAYSLLSTVLLAWLIVAAGRAPVVVLWDQAVWHRWLVNLVMPVALGLAVFGIAVCLLFALWHYLALFCIVLLSFALACALFVLWLSLALFCVLLISFVFFGYLLLYFVVFDVLLLFLALFCYLFSSFVIFGVLLFFLSFF